jgi:hypothetical protein
MPITLDNSTANIRKWKEYKRINIAGTHIDSEDSNDPASEDKESDLEENPSQKDDANEGDSDFEVSEGEVLDESEHEILEIMQEINCATLIQFRINELH